MRSAVVLSVFLGSTSSTLLAGTIHVDDDAAAGGDGSVASPFDSIQEAIDAADKGDEVLVAAGTYVESIDLLGKAITLRSSDGAETTTISADGGTTVRMENQEHHDTVLEGFTITGGDSDEGGGIKLTYTSPTIRDCIVSGNTAIDGGGLFTRGGQPCTVGSTFSNNTAVSGGGVLATESPPLFETCVFSGNSAEMGAGLMATSGVVLSDCVFIGNTGLVEGGGAFVGGNDSEFIGCLFTNNSAPNGGGVSTISGSVELVSCSFHDNSASAEGGAIRLGWNFFVSVEACVMSGNTATLGGGILADVSNTFMPYAITDSTFFGNDAQLGGAIYIRTDTRLTGTSVSGNTAILGGGVYVEREMLDLAGVVLSENLATLSGGGAYLLPDGALSGEDVQFTDNAAGVEGGGVHAIGAGVTLERGAFVGNDAASIGGGLSTVFSAVQIAGASFVGNTAGSNLAVDGGGGFDVRDGTLLLDGCVFTANAATPLNPSGGWGGAGRASNVTGAVTACVIAGNAAGRGAGLALDEVALAITDCFIEGNISGRSGGGLHQANSASVITRCTFSANECGASNTGAGMLASYDDSVIVDCLFQGNIAQGSGGGMALGGSTTLIERCRFLDNAAPSASALYNSGGATLVRACLFEGNTSFGLGRGGTINDINRGVGPAVYEACRIVGNNSPGQAGGINLFVADSEFHNCLIAGNVGRGVYFRQSVAKFINCTIVDNAEAVAAGFQTYQFVRPGEILSIENCIVRGTGGTVMAGPFNAAFCNIEGGAKGAGNMDADPGFVDAANGVYRLAAGAACIDAGNNDLVPIGVQTDLAGGSRFVDDPETPDTGFGTAPIVDMGAFEFGMCTADVNDDDEVDVDDLIAVILAWGTNDASADVDGDGIVTVGDLVEVIIQWGLCG